MLDTFEALVVAAIALLPGAVYTWAFEQRVSRVASGRSDRLWRFAGISAAFMSVLAPLFYVVYGQLIVNGQLRQGGHVGFGWWLLPPAYVVVPWVIGTVVGVQARQRSRWVSILTGPAPSPRAWDHFFTTPDLAGWMVLRLRDGGWVAGFWGTEETPGSVKLRSYASGYPDVQEVYFADTAKVDSEGSVQLDAEGRPVSLGLGLLIRWDEVSYAYYGET